MNKFFSYATLCVVAIAAAFSSCSDDDDKSVRAKLVLSQQAIFFSELNQSQAISYKGSDIIELTIDESDIPDGWVIDIVRGREEVVVYGPTTEEDFEKSLTSSIITFSALSKDDQTTLENLTVGATKSFEDLSDLQANSFIASKPNTIYRFDAYSTGEEQGTITPHSVGILWQTYPAPLSYSRLVDGKVEFYTKILKDDDSADTEDKLIEGNAVIAAYDKSGEILWSWHIWVSDFSAEESQVTLNNTTIMSRNLGANDNSTTDDDTILESYGLYYQWGRKDPFVGPYYYNAAAGTDASMTNEAGTSAYIAYSKSTSKIGTEDYARKNPLTFILGVEESSYDWIYSAHSSDLWGETKSINDPCPKGWRVASPETFDGLLIPTLSSDEMNEIADNYGWLLSDSEGNSSLFMGVGRRGYITGKVQNVNLNENRPAPWAGYYWSNDADSADEGSSSAMYFAYDKTDAAKNEILTSTYYRSNGMQVRCQRNE